MIFRRKTGCTIMANLLQAFLRPSGSKHINFYLVPCFMDVALHIAGLWECNMCSQTIVLKLAINFHDECTAEFFSSLWRKCHQIHFMGEETKEHTKLCVQEFGDFASSSSSSWVSKITVTFKSVIHVTYLEHVKPGSRNDRSQVRALTIGQTSCYLSLSESLKKKAGITNVLQANAKTPIFPVFCTTGAMAQNCFQFLSTPMKRMAL